MKPVAIIIGLGISSLVCAPAMAESNQSFCVKCTGPEQTYRCDVQVPTGVSSTNAMQFYCVVNVAKDRGHASCSARKATSDLCDGPIVSYVYSGPAIKTHTSNIDTPQARENPVPPDGIAEGPEPITPGQAPHDTAKKPKSKEPETLVELTNDAVDASGKQLKKAGKAVQNVGSKTGEVVGDVAKKAGDSASQAAKNVGNIAVKTGKAVGNAAKSTFYCVVSLFQDC